jgi:hypothetical protein
MGNKGIIEQQIPTSFLTAGKVSEIRYLIFCLINALQVHPAHSQASYAHALVYIHETF